MKGYEFGIKRKSKIAVCICLSVIIAVTLGVLGQLSREIRKSIENSVRMTLINVTEQSAKVVYKELTAKQRFLSAIAEEVVNDDLEINDKLLQKLSAYARAYGMYSIGILYPDGECHLDQRRTIDLSGREYYLKSFEGESVITKSILSCDGKSKYLNVFTMPIEKGETIPFALIATYESNDFFELLKTDSFGGIGRSVIVDSEGKAVITTTNSVNVKQEDIIAYIYNNPEITPNSSESNYFTFEYNGEKYLSCMKDIGIGDWYILTYVDKTSAFHEANLIQKSVLSISCVLLSIIVITLTILIVITIKYQKGIQKVVFVDELLGTNNYEYLRVWFEHLTCEQKEDLFLAVMDIDGFKALNMSYGSESCDRLLKYISESFEKSCPNDQIYRRYADHFVCIMHGKNKTVIEKSLDTFLMKIQTDVKMRKIIPFVLSIGVCSLEAVQHLYNGYTQATLAKNSIKGNYINQYAFFEDSLREVSVRNMELRSLFNIALQNREFQIVYQPKYDMRFGEIVGAEALVRWVKPNGQIISPGEFISCFEDSGQIIQLDEYVFETVCAEMAEMQSKGIPVKRVSVNLSRVNVKYSNIVMKLRKAIDQFQVQPQNLAIELTESAIFDDAKKVCDLVNELHSLGCRVDMDDYGTGISSLLSLANADFDVIKLDRSFVNSIGNKKMEAVIKFTLDLARELNLIVVAEGVESKEETEFLMCNGCYYAQGYYFSKLVSREVYEEMLRNKTNKHNHREI